jgi:hypothetical protein
MNHREPTSVLRGTGQALPCLALLILPLLALNRAWSRPNLPATSTSIAPPGGYLIAVGAPSLRFQAANPPPDLVTRPAASAPPKIGAESSVSHPDVVVYTPTSTSAATPSEQIQPHTEHAAGVTTSSEEESTEAPRTPPPILRDELHRQTRPEDVLPYFRIPAAQPGDVDVIVPAPRTPGTPAPLPQSSATYTQSPR